MKNSNMDKEYLTTGVKPIITCFFCGRDMSEDATITYVARMSICSICLDKPRVKNYIDFLSDPESFDDVDFEV